MPEAKNMVFTFKEIAEALIRKANIHEGLWGVFVRFGIAGANVGSGPKSEDLRPAAIVPIVELGIQKFDEPNNLTVDAAEVNPEKAKKK